MLANVAYLVALTLLAPWLMWRRRRTGRYRQHLAAKLWGRVRIANPDGKPVAWFHGVSVGEVHLLGTLVAAFRKRHPEFLCVVSSTTDTGLAEARSRFADLPVIAWPFDFTWAAANALDAVRPAVVVLAEGELWPNFLAAAATRGIPVVVVNARLSPRSFGRYARVAWFARRLLFRHLAVVAAQCDDTAARFRKLGLPPEKLRVTGSVKYDGAGGDRDTPKARELRRLFPSPLTLVAGSTHAPEEAIVLAAFARLRERFPALGLILVPRHPDRFADVAKLLEGSAFARRSELAAPTDAPILLLDTVGELGAAWGLADVGYVGGTLDGVRGGQSMIEPAGYGVPTVFGPHAWNFRDAARRLVEAGGAVVVRSADELENEVAKLLADTARRGRMGGAARDLVRAQQGATARTLDAIAATMPRRAARAA